PEPEVTPEPKVTPEPAQPAGSQANNSDAQALNAMFGSALSKNVEVAVNPSSNLDLTSSEQHKASASARSLPAYEVKSQQVVEEAMVKSQRKLAEASSARQERSSSSLLNRERASESGQVDQAVAGLFNDFNKDVRQLVMAYQLRKQPLRVTLHFTQGSIDKVTVKDAPDAFVRELQSLLLGQRISMPYTGIKSHALVVN
ncbi:TPA: hypothetical protein ACVU4T_004993, partial [Vibrio parahaemolyticus]